ncbi:MAG: hypothetical protein OEX01_08700 [Candidatus Bathyarchaeota archaeon]|nr:hypothetical protein [Candidatus Bathyarchaeota archaeon]
MISVDDEDCVLIHLKRNALPMIIQATSAEMDWANSEKVGLPLGELFKFCLKANLPLVELEDRYITLTNPTFWARKEEEKEEGEQ